MLTENLLLFLVVMPNSVPAIKNQHFKNQHSIFFLPLYSHQPKSINSINTSKIKNRYSIFLLQHLFQTLPGHICNPPLHTSSQLQLKLLLPAAHSYAKPCNLKKITSLNFILLSINKYYCSCQQTGKTTTNIWRKRIQNRIAKNHYRIPAHETSSPETGKPSIIA